SSDRARGTLLHSIDGASRPSASGETFETHAPIDGRPLARVAAGDAADIDLAATAAARAFQAWRDVPGGERRRLLHRIADAVEARSEEIALVEAMDTGQPIRFMAEIGRAEGREGGDGAR